MADRLDTIRKRLASGNPFGAYGTDLVWALDEIERLTAALGAAEEALVDHEHMHPSSCLVYRMPEMAHEDEVAMWRRWADGGSPGARAEIARLDALSRATGEELRAESLDETENQA